MVLERPSLVPFRLVQKDGTYFQATTMTPCVPIPTSCANRSFILVSENAPLPHPSFPSDQRSLAWVAHDNDSETASVADADTRSQPSRDQSHAPCRVTNIPQRIVRGIVCFLFFSTIVFSMPLCPHSLAPSPTILLSHREVGSSCCIRTPHVW